MCKSDTNVNIGQEVRSINSEVGRDACSKNAGGVRWKTMKEYVPRYASL